MDVAFGDDGGGCHGGLGLVLRGLVVDVDSSVDVVDMDVGVDIFVMVVVV